MYILDSKQRRTLWQCGTTCGAVDEANISITYRRKKNSLQTAVTIRAPTLLKDVKHKTMLSYKKQDVYFLLFSFEYNISDANANGCNWSFKKKKKVLTTDDNFVNITILPQSNSILADKHL